MAQFGAPNFLGVISAYEAGADRAERSRLRDLAEQGRVLQGKALSGDQNALAQLGQVNPQAYMQTKQFSTEQKQQFLKDFARSAYDATTPEKYAAVVQRFRSQGHNFDPGEDAFENRQSMINQVIDIGDRMGMDLRREEAARDQRNADRSFGLQERGFNADQSYRQQQLALEKQKLNQPDLSSDLKEYNFALSQGFKGSFVDYKNALKSGNQLSVTLPDGTTINQGPGKPMTEFDSKGAVYATRAQGALPLIDQYGDALTSLGENVGARAPLVGNYMKTPAYQQAEQAGREFLQAILRKDTGAAITKEETAEYGTVYLPQPGDSAQVIQQKRVSRLRALEAMKAGLTPKAILAMETAGMNVDRATGGKGDMNGTPRIRTYNPATDELE